VKSLFLCEDGFQPSKLGRLLGGSRKWKHYSQIGWLSAFVRQHHLCQPVVFKIAMQVGLLVSTVKKEAIG
jgi:hypothetical protein